MTNSSYEEDHIVHIARAEDQIVGTIAIAKSGEMRLVASQDEFGTVLTAIIGEINAKTTLTIKTAPPPGAEPCAFSWREVARDTPDILWAISRYLQDRYDMDLIPVSKETRADP